MTRLPLALLFASTFAFGACKDGTDDGGGFGEQDPWRDSWQTVVDGAVLPTGCPDGENGCPCGTGDSCDEGVCGAASTGTEYCLGSGGTKGKKGNECDDGTCDPGLTCVLFPDFGAEGCVDENDAVSALTIGGRQVDDNFMNRGDVEVYFDGPEGQITVELRRFTFAPNKSEAQKNWDRLHAWNYSSTVAAPAEKMPEEDCSSAFRNGCQIRVWYDGLTQPVRDGADIRVILPPSYTGQLGIETEDNIAEDAYPDRGDVRVKGWRGQLLEVELDSGNVDIEMAEDTLSAPICGEAANTACDEFVDPDTMEPAAWSLDCGCTEFGKIQVDSRPERASNITVDVPSGLWGTTRMENSQAGLTKDSDPVCLATPDCGGLDGDCKDVDYDDAFPWRHNAEFNDPGDANLDGTGYQINLVSQGCQNVTFAAGPDDWSGPMGDPEVETRGDVLMCSGCLDIASP
jgi:hypothetical protein